MISVFPADCFFIYLRMLCLCVDSGRELNLNSGSDVSECWLMEALCQSLECKFGFTIATSGWIILFIGLIRIILYLMSVISSSWFTSDMPGTQPSWKSDHFIRLLSEALESFLQPSASEMKKCRLSYLHAFGFRCKNVHSKLKTCKLCILASPRPCRLLTACSCRWVEGRKRVWLLETLRDKGEKKWISCLILFSVNRLRNITQFIESLPIQRSIYQHSSKRSLEQEQRFLSSDRT